MQFEIITIFPEFFAGPLDYGIVRRAREARLVDVRVHDLRAFTHDRHRTVDDRPFGGGEGMVLKPEPLFEAVESLLGDGVPPGGRAKVNSDIGFVGARHAVPLQREATPAAGKDKVADREFVRGEMFGHALVHSFIAAAQQDDPIELREPARRILAK
jgi:hypothetical protein